MHDACLRYSGDKASNSSPLPDGGGRQTVKTLFAHSFACRAYPTLSRLCIALLCFLAMPSRAAGLPPVTGIVWQLYEKAPNATGTWHRLGARELLIQWTAVDGIAYVPGTQLRESRRMPDWRRIGREPWAERVIVGLSGRSDEKTARRSLDAMLAESLAISRLRFPFEVSAWYFPAEVDPKWKNASSALPPVVTRRTPIA
jgi:hypothetical protein